MQEAKLQSIQTWAKALQVLNQEQTVYLFQSAFQYQLAYLFQYLKILLA